MSKAEGDNARRLIVSQAPHVHLARDLRSVMRDVVLALLPALLVGFWVFGLDAVRVTALAVGGCLLAEWAFCRLARRPSRLRDLSALVTGLLLAMNLPSNSPWWLVLAGCFIAIVLAKQLFGGLGYNPFNPALVARVFLLISFPVPMTRWVLPQGPATPLDATTGATPLGLVAEALSRGQQIDSIAGQLPGTTTLLLGLRGGSLGEVSCLALLLGGLYLLWRGVIRWQIPVAFIATVFAISAVAHLLAPSACAPPLFHVLGGGLFLGAFFMATDMVTSPITRRGMLIFGVGCGVITAVIRLWGGYPEGVSFAILLMNAATPLIDRYVRPRAFGTGRSLHGKVAA